ncbi:MAG: hypothetical protein ACLUIQ_03580 [Dialister invisus]
MNDRQRYAVGIAAAVLIHLFAAVMLGLFGVKYMEVPFRGEVLQVSLDAGGGNRGGEAAKGERRRRRNHLKQKSMMLLNLWKCLMKKLMKRQRKKSRSRRTGRIRRNSGHGRWLSASDAAAGNEGMNTQGDGSGSGGKRETGTAAEPVPVKVTAMEAGRSRRSYYAADSDK